MFMGHDSPFPDYGLSGLSCMLFPFYSLSCYILSGLYILCLWCPWLLTFSMCHENLRVPSQDFELIPRCLTITLSYHSNKDIILRRFMHAAIVFEEKFCERISGYIEWISYFLILSLAGWNWKQSTTSLLGGFMRGCDDISSSISNASDLAFMHLCFHHFKKESVKQYVCNMIYWIYIAQSYLSLWT